MVFPGRRKKQDREIVNSNVVDTGNVQPESQPTQQPVQPSEISIEDLYVAIVGMNNAIVKLYLEAERLRKVIE